MKIENKQIIINVLNENCKNPQIPSYSHVVIEGKIYPLKGNLKELEKLKLDKEEVLNTYCSFVVNASGEIEKSKGNMPNPMVRIECFDLVKIH